MQRGDVWILQVISTFIRHAHQGGFWPVPSCVKNKLLEGAERARDPVGGNPCVFNIPQLFPRGGKVRVGAEQSLDERQCLEVCLPVEVELVSFKQERV